MSLFLPFARVSLPLLALQSRCGDEPVKFQVVSPQNGTAALKGLTAALTHENEKKTLLWGV